MNTPNSVLMKSARETLKGRWGLAIKATLIYMLIGILLRFIPIVGPILSILISGPLVLGFTMFFLTFSRNQNPPVSTLFHGFDNFWRAFKAYWWLVICIFLRFLLLIVPGIIAIYAYSQTFFILSEDKNIGINDALKKSKQMMMGNKSKFFELSLRIILKPVLIILTILILWAVVNVLFHFSGATGDRFAPLTLGFIIIFFLIYIATVLWFTPYLYVTMAKFYDDIKGGTPAPDVPEVVAVPVAQ